jgi:glucose/arabinose dehydrogenase
MEVAVERTWAVLLAISCAICVIALEGCGGVSGSKPPTPATPATPPTNLTLTPLITGLSSPVDLQQPNDGTGRFFVVEQAGRIRVFQNDALLSTPFLDITSKVTMQDEMGLLGMAFHPSFTQNGRFYVHYDRTTASGGFQSVIAEYAVSAADPNQADPASERIVLTVDQPPFANHKGGQIAFGPDGFLYIGLGDGGSEGDPNGIGQNPNTLLAKILRIDVNTTSGGKQYGIPPDNPFVSGGGLPETWVWGLRNPYRFSFDRSTGTLFAGDVGQDRYEEIDIIQKGANYGWSIMEGFHCFKPPTGCNQSGLTLPIAEYDHSEGNAVIGGYVYRGSQIPALQQGYIFGDDGSGKIWELQQTSPGTWTRTLLISSGRTISSFGQDQNGEVYVVDLSGNVLSITQP